ncbi:MAG: cyclic nucleotide-binding domain-containing protein [Proteobacteria bacterium]|nr:cyclic nucleotide-binding domain-containing protein [Pseudomonadota bacterium]
MSIDVSLLGTLAPLNSIAKQHQIDIAEKTSVESVGVREILFKNGEKDNQHVYLISGTIELLKDDKVVKTVKADDAEQLRQPLAHNQPRVLTGRAATHCKIVRLDSNMLDVVLTWNQTGTYQVNEISEMEVLEDNDDWMVKILKSQPFAHIPPANMQAIFMRMEVIDVKAGEVVAKQGTPGDYFYVIKSGKSMVIRATKKNPKGLKLAELREGNSFGEDSILAECNRNASVVMLTAGSVIRISKKDFLEYLKAPQIETTKINDALKMQKDGAVLIDVRLPDECKMGVLPGSINIPLVFLRMKMAQLDKSKQYIVYCDTGRRSTNACYLMRERGLKTLHLVNGITSRPDLLKTPG